MDIKDFLKLILLKKMTFPSENVFLWIKHHSLFLLFYFLNIFLLPASDKWIFEGKVHINAYFIFFHLIRLFSTKFVYEIAYTLVDCISIENDREADIRLYGNRAFSLTRPINFPQRKGNWVGTVISLRGWGWRARIRRHGIFSKFKLKRT